MNKRSLPDGWSLKKIGELATVVSGGTPSRNQPKYWVNGNIPWVTPTDITRDNSLTLSEAKEKITELGLRSSSANLLPSGTLLMTSRATVGEIKISSVPVSTNQGFKNLIPNALVDKWYLYYQMVFHKESYKQLGNGSTFLEVSKSATESFEIYYAPLPEQRTIADILSTVDEAIVQSESLVGKYQSIKQGLMSDLLTRGVDENGDIRDPGKFVETLIGNYPKTWTITSLGNLVLKNGGFIQTGPFGSQLHSYEYVEQGIPVIMPQDIMEDGKISEDNITRITVEKAKELSRHIVKPNDVVFARRGDLSRCSAITEHEGGWLCGTGSMLIRPPQKEIDGRWLAAVYRHEICQHQIRARAVGSTMVNLNSTLLRDLAIPRPPLKEQAVIMEIIESQDSLLSAEVDGLAKLRLLKQGLMQDLLSGQVRVSGLMK